MAGGAGTRGGLREPGRSMSHDDLTPPATATSGLRAQMLDHLRDATLGEYEILLELGSGGMATVYLAHDLQLDRQVAIKLMHPALLPGQDMVERFLLEARTAAKLSHANIVPIHAVKMQEDLLYFVMKFIEGRPLDSIIREQAPLDADMVRHIVMQVSDALAYAHRHGVIHRDVKPANIIISTDGHPVLADFGIAKVADRPGLTMTGATIGTPTYMSPEQCDAQALTGASDQYSLGVTAYEMLAGKPPFDAPSYMGILMKHMTEPPRPLREVVPHCPPDVAEVVERMLSKQPEQRFADLEQVVEALTPATVGKQHKVRTQLVQYALADPQRQRISQLSVPVSPIPTGSRRARSGTRRGAPVEKRTPPWAIGAMVLLATVVGGLLVGRPWEGANTPPLATRDPANSAAPVTPHATPPATPPTVVPAPPAEAPRLAAVPPPDGRTPTPPTRTVERDRILPVASIRLTGPESLAAGIDNLVTAELRTEDGSLITGRPVAWVSSDAAVLSVDAAGRLRALRPGRATISASADGVSQSLGITVTPEPVAAVAVTPHAVTLAPGGSVQLNAHITGASGGALDRPLEWSSSAPTVATVTPAGRVTAIAPGTATITASHGGKSDGSSVSVPAPASVAPTEAEVREQVSALIAAYARALEAGDMARIRELYPGIPPSRALQLQGTLATMTDRQVRLGVDQVHARNGGAEARVTGTWSFTANGQRNTLPADDRYVLERRGSGWIITDIR